MPDNPGRTRANVPLAVRRLIEQYRRFLRTSYRFLDEHLRRQFEEHLAAIDVVVKGPYVTLAREFVPGRTLAGLVAAGEADPELARLRWAFGANPLHRHQERALALGRAGESFVVTTGTGSGKTASFLLPVLDAVLRRKRDGVRGVQAILLYPMNALANDQLERLRRLVRGTGVDLSFGLYTGDSDVTTLRLQEEPAESERLRRAEIRAHPPDLLLTNYKQLEFLLVRREDRHLFGPALRHIVLDELHSYRGALASEIACLLRRLRSRAGLVPGELLAIGTSATVASGAYGRRALAAFASTLFGETVTESSVVGEERRPVPLVRDPAPPPPVLDEAALEGFDPADDGTVIALAERLTGQPVPAGGSLPQRIAALFAANGLVQLLAGVFAEPHSLGAAVARLREEFADRRALDDETLRREIEAYLLVGSVGDDSDPPCLRPKLHTFFHGVYDVGLCLEPGCRTLVPQGGSECPVCGAAARPAALCRTCGQDFYKVVLPAEPSAPTEGTADFYSTEHTAFLTPRLHELSEAEEEEEEEGRDAAAEEAPAGRRRRKGKETGKGCLCPECGRLLPAGSNDTACPACNRATVEVFVFRGKLSTCPTCGDVYTRGDIVTPLRTGTASTVSVLATHHLDDLGRDDRKLLVFADNRQDAAHQAGYSADRHRAFALRHSILAEVEAAGASGVPLVDLPQRLLDRFREIRVIPARKLTESERRRWLDALTIQAASEFTRAMRQRAALEMLGLVGVDYEFLDDVVADPRFAALAGRHDLSPAPAGNVVRAILDLFRRARAVGFDFFREYIDPNRHRKYRELEEEPFNLRFADHDRAPRAFALDRPSALRRGLLQGLVQENPKAGNLPAPQKLAVKLLGDRARAEEFLRGLVPLLREHELLEKVESFPIPKREWSADLVLLQLASRVVLLKPAEEGFRCNACRTWRPYRLSVCPNPRCAHGVPQPATAAQDSYYVRLYRDYPPRRFQVREHSAQIAGETRADLERDFKEGRLEALVCTPTLELGVDIGPLLTVVLRNAPPTPANYSQRVGRAGRRLQIGFASTFCTGGAHDRHAFMTPEWLISGEFSPPRIRLDNPRVVERHLRSLLLENLNHELPTKLGELLDNEAAPTRWRREALEPLLSEVTAQRHELAEKLAALFDADREKGLRVAFDRAEAAALVGAFAADLERAFEGWWERVRQLDREYQELSQIGSPRQDERKARARKRAYFELTQDREKAYTLNYLSTRGLLPAYQFPLDTFSLDPGVEDTPTLHRPAAIAIEEFAPGNFVYANGHKLRSIRVLFPGGPGSPAGAGRSDAESSGRLEELHFCAACDEAVETPRNQCPRCAAPLPSPTPLLFVDTFEAEENLRIGADEESRQRERQLKRETLRLPPDCEATLHEYPLAPSVHLRLAEILVTNWGRTDRKRDDGRRFWLCPDCGRHCPYDPPSGEKADPVTEKNRRAWLEGHARFCSGELARLVLAYRFRTDALVVAVPGEEEPGSTDRRLPSTLATTLSEALRLGASEVLELEADEIASFVRRRVAGTPGEEIVLYETTPGGSGYTAEIARRLSEVAAAARRALYEHRCSRACYLCLKHYRNQWLHAQLDKDLVRTPLLALEGLEPVTGRPVAWSALQETLGTMLDERAREARTGGAEDPRTGRYRKGYIEEPLLAALAGFPELAPPLRDHEIRDGERLVTVPDFAWPDLKLAVYCDGYAYHGDPASLELDARKRNWLQGQGWAVLTFWGRTILQNPQRCAAEVANVAQGIASRRASRA
ncbi:MAG TPA: DEAD/DEAH box helicase [Thermoanaerobaculia bacterium]|nr:DEAD/DEAH box helicase [Thermoanaerobaculia bacterium]